MSPQALAILEAMPRLAGNNGEATFVFTTNGNTPISCFSDIKGTIAAGAPAVPDWRMHDIRRTIATNMQRLGTPEPVIEAVLNHAATDVTRKHYALHRYDNEKRQALCSWATRLENIISDQTAKVIALRG